MDTADVMRQWIRAEIEYVLACGNIDATHDADSDAERIVADYLFDYFKQKVKEEMEWLKNEE
jgi:hypothetical protein